MLSKRNKQFQGGGIKIMLDDYSRKVVWHKIEDKKGWIMEINSIYLTLKKDSIFNDIQATLQGVTFTYERKFIIIYLC